ncbi:hypothetical protein AB1Y20_014846 [Prymnesium parvum]|uniref:Uncharacterized protein n=1 Tax=Prymnesium parvum TaxID=97485 RepID=A0AB34JYC8_PRYPA
MAGSTVGCCGQLVVGWRRHEAPFMKRVAHSAPPRLPPPPPSSSRRTAPCGALLLPLHSLCSGCLASVPMGVLLADGEALCEVCVCATFDHVEQRAAAPPRLALFARREEIELLRPQLPPRDFALLLAVRAGDELRCCECIPRLDVRGRACAFVGFCLRRRVAVVRLGASLAAHEGE